MEEELVSAPASGKSVQVGVADSSQLNPYMLMTNGISNYYQFDIYIFILKDLF